MLLELRVNDFAIIDSVSIQFKNHLNILSGETGAGKSVLLKSLSLLMGGKASSSIVRSGAKQASIEGLFDLNNREDIIFKLNEFGFDSDSKELIVRRLISAQGKSKIYLNGSLSTLTQLQAVVCPLIEVTGHAAPLIEVTGQHDSKSLLSKSYHLDILDQYANTLKDRSKFYSLYQERKHLLKKIENLQENQQLLNQKLDFLRFQKEELDSFDLKEDEDIQLEENYHKQKNLDKLCTFLNLAEELLYFNDTACIPNLQTLLHRSNEASKYDSLLEEKMELIQQACTLLEEGLRELQIYKNKINNETETVNNIEERLNQLRKIQNKYGKSFTDIKLAQTTITEEIFELENFENNLETMKLKLKSINKNMHLLANKMHKTRTNTAKILANSVNAELKDLNMKGLQFSVYIKNLEDFKPSGFSEIEFQIQLGKNETAKALAKTASGGELSRILLALKQVIGSNEKSRTYLFDEVDTGVSGETAEKVGKKLAEISSDQQVICVTHLPQVASYGSTHFYIEKLIHKDRSIMHIKELKKSDRIKEIARLISGEKISKTSLAHAKQLLEL